MSHLAPVFGVSQEAPRFTQTRIEQATLQAVADRLHDTFVAEFRAGRVDVVPQAELDADTVSTGKGLPLITLGLQDKKWFPGQAEGISAHKTVLLGCATTAKTLQAPLLHVKLALSMVELKGRGWGGSSQFGNLTLKSAWWTFGADPMPRFVEGGTAVLVSGADLSGRRHQPTAADADLDVEPASFSDRMAADAAPVLRLFVQAMPTR